MLDKRAVGYDARGGEEGKEGYCWKEGDTM
jgi:hypothetical protein